MDILLYVCCTTRKLNLKTPKVLFFFFLYITHLFLIFHLSLTKIGGILLFFRIVQMPIDIFAFYKSNVSSCYDIFDKFNSYIHYFFSYFLGDGCRTIDHNAIIGAGIVIGFMTVIICIMFRMLSKSRHYIFSHQCVLYRCVPEHACVCAFVCELS